MSSKILLYISEIVLLLPQNKIDNKTAVEFIESKLTTLKSDFLACAFLLQRKVNCQTPKSS